MQTQLTQRLKRAGLVAGLAGSVLVFGACSRPGSGEAEATAAPTPGAPTVATVTRTGVTGTRATPTRANTGPAVTTPTPGQPATSPTNTPATALQGERYVVQAGDTLLQIANRYGVTVEAIVQANKLENPDVLRVGQELIIPRP